MLRANHAPYVSRALRKAIMKRSCLENISKNTIIFSRAYTKQKRFCSRLYKIERKAFFNNLNLKFVCDNKLFWKTVKPLFSIKGSHNGF